MRGAVKPIRHSGTGVRLDVAAYRRMIQRSRTHRILTEICYAAIIRISTKGVRPRSRPFAVCRDGDVRRGDPEAVHVRNDP